MTVDRSLTISTGELATIDEAFAWVIATMDGEGLVTPSISIRAYWLDDDFGTVCYEASVWGSVR